jgi:hypothetical protein
MKTIKIWMICGSITPYLEFVVFWVVDPCSAWPDTNVSEDSAASIFRVEVRGLLVYKLNTTRCNNPENH